MAWLNAWLQRVEKFPPASEIPRLLGHETAPTPGVIATLADDPERAAKFDAEVQEHLAYWKILDGRTAR